MVAWDKSTTSEKSRAWVCQHAMRAKFPKIQKTLGGASAPTGSELGGEPPDGEQGGPAGGRAPFGQRATTFFSSMALSDAAGEYAAANAVDCCGAVQFQRVTRDQLLGKDGKRIRATELTKAHAAANGAPATALTENDLRCAADGQLCKAAHTVAATMVVPHSAACKAHAELAQGQAVTGVRSIVQEPLDCAQQAGVQTGERRRQQKPPSKMVAEALRADFEMANRSWDDQALTNHVKRFVSDPDRMYLRHVKDDLLSTNLVDEKQRLELLQGMVYILRQDGWGATLLLADGATVLAQAVEIAAAQHDLRHKHKKAQGLPSQPFDTAAALVEFADVYPDVDESGAPIEYVMGWLLVPPNVLGDNLSHFPPFSAIDNARMLGDAQGSLYGRATVDGDKHIQIVTLSRVLCGEASTSAAAFFHQEREVHSEASEDSGACVLNHPSYLTNLDGGQALIVESMTAYPNSGGYMRDPWHMEQTHVHKAVGKRAIGLMKKIARMPPNLKAQAQEILASDPEASAYLERASGGLRHVSAAFLEPGVEAHGLFTSTPIEIWWSMMKRAGVRHKKDMFESAFAAVQLIQAQERSKHVSIDKVLRTAQDEQRPPCPPSMIAALLEAKKKAATLQAPEKANLGWGQGSERCYYVRSSNWLEDESCPSPQNVSLADRHGASPDAAAAQHIAGAPRYCVRLQAAGMGNWRLFCECGQATVQFHSVDKHAYKCLADARRYAPFDDVQKAWTTMNGWCKQHQYGDEHGMAAKDVTPGRLVAAVQHLRLTGQLRNLKVPNIVLSRSKAKKDKEGSVRGKGIVELVRETTTATAASFHQVAPSSKPKQVQKCGHCKQAGHKSNRCPQAAALFATPSPADNPQTGSEPPSSIRRPELPTTVGMASLLQPSLQPQPPSFIRRPELPTTVGMASLMQPSLQPQQSPQPSLQPQPSPTPSLRPMSVDVSPQQSLDTSPRQSPTRPLPWAEPDPNGWYVWNKGPYAGRPSPYAPGASSQLGGDYIIKVQCMGEVTPLHLRRADGPSWSFLLGAGDDNDVVLKANNVSESHARLEGRLDGNNEVTLILVPVRAPVQTKPGNESRNPLAATHQPD